MAGSGLPFHLPRVFFNSFRCQKRVSSVCFSPQDKSGSSISKYRNYNFKNGIDPKFGGSAFIGGLKTSIRLFKIQERWFQPYFSILTGKFHAGKGIILDAGIPLLKVPRSPFIINSSVRANIVQKTGGTFTGWLDYGLFIGYPIYY